MSQIGGGGGSTNLGQNPQISLLFFEGVPKWICTQHRNFRYSLLVEVLNGVTFGIFYATMTSYAYILSPPGI